MPMPKGTTPANDSPSPPPAAPTTGAGLDEDLVARLAKITDEAPDAAGEPDHFWGPRRDAFFYRFVPGESGWEPSSRGLDKTYLLPLLAPHFLSVGANGTATIPSGAPPETAYREALVRLQMRGEIVLVREANRLPEALLPERIRKLRAAQMLPNAGGYCQRFKTRMRGQGQPLRDTFLEAWSYPKPAGARTRRTEFGFDVEAYNRFRLWLVVTGKIPLPLEGEVEETTHGYRQSLELARNSSAPAEVRERQVSQEEALLQMFAEAQVPQVAA